MKDAESPKIVIIDDSRSFSMLLGSMLRGMGIRTINIFDECDAAISYMRTNPVDIALIDGDIPKSCGLKFARALRLDKQMYNRTVPLVLMSGKGGPKVMEKAIEAGFDAVLPKPVRTTQLRQQIVQLTEKPRVYIHARSGYCGPDRRRKSISEFTGENRRRGETFQVYTQNGPVSLGQLEKLHQAGTGTVDLEVLLVRGVKILSGYRLDSRVHVAA